LLFLGCAKKVGDAVNGSGDRTNRLVDGIVELLLSRYGEDALLKAAFCARAAVSAGKIRDCLIWREVMDSLAMKRGSRSGDHRFERFPM
jgi:hypothetical protein